MLYALKLAFTSESGAWAGLHNFTDTATDYRFLPALEHVLIYTSVWLGLLIVLVVVLALLLHGRASRASSTFRFLYYIPGRAGRRRVGPGLAVHARPVGQSWLVLRPPRARRPPLRRVDRARETCPSSSR